MKKWISHFAEWWSSTTPTLPMNLPLCRIIIHHHTPSSNESPTLRNDNPPPLPPFHPNSDPNLRLNQPKAKIPPDDAQQRRQRIFFLKMWSFCEITLNDIFVHRWFYGNIWNKKDWQVGLKLCCLKCQKWFSHWKQCLTLHPFSGTSSSPARGDLPGVERKKKCEIWNLPSNGFSHKMGRNPAQYGERGKQSDPLAAGINSVWKAPYTV